MNDEDKNLSDGSAAHDATQRTRRKILKAGTTVAAGAVIAPLLQSSNADAAPNTDGARTLILASHPYPERSVVNKALWEVAQKAPNASFRNMESVFGNKLSSFDRAAERKRYEQMERLVLIYPTHWFNLTPLLKAYLNDVWGAGAPPELRGKELLVVTTTGGSERDYSREGSLGFTIEEVLTPLRASANYTGMKFAKPLVFFGASGDSESLGRYQEALRARLA
ncbi:NAD(P)H-dependent oxidoreductase [Pigmentiphaga aceris]|uniref:NAD(P)H-dependent oxidoreductase n=1 Tax=Pigmentiphaga aceris TaxID=1940612 RepID=A0A5C0B5R0_9BURK|nr:NAD(P)H-dependent oxidoreductase [Pigmentiphaga aceris]QEI09296.1 NAD(P)H-dependent oxidoreductase [Pigmentiphaga aceris]